MDSVNCIAGYDFGNWHHFFAFVLSFSVSYRFLCREKVLKVWKVKVLANRSSSLPQKTLLLKHLAISPRVADLWTFSHDEQWR